MGRSKDPSMKDIEKRGLLKVWLDGEMVKYGDARVPILTHSLQYGSGVFEGIRAYKTGEGSEIFRLKDHIRRFINSAKIYSMDLGYGEEELENAVVKVVKANGLESCYIRPFAFYNSDQIGVSTTGKRVSVFIAAIPFGAYFGKGKETGIRCKISSWRRINSNILPVEAKASGNYINSIIANLEAMHSGYDEAILLSNEGYVAEGPGENIFLVRDGRLITPDTSADILLGETRDSLIKIAKSMGIEVDEREVHKEELYTADEAFFAGTAAEITPIINIDGIKVGNGGVGQMTKRLSERYGKIVHGEDGAYESWLTRI